MSRQPRLLIATSVPSTLTAFLLPYASHYRALGWQVDAICNLNDDPNLKEWFDNAYHVPWTRHPLEPVNLLRAPKIFSGVVRRNGYDLVHLHDPVAAFVGRFALRSLRKRGEPKVIYTAHGFHFFAGAPPLSAAVYRGLEMLASRWTDRLIVINQEDLAAARRFPIPEARVMYMPGIGVDMARYSPDSVTAEEAVRTREVLGLDPDQVMVLMVAEFNAGKRHLDAVTALALADRPQLVLALAGVGPMTEEVRGHAATLGVSDKVIFLGYRNDIPALLKASGGLILPSEREGLPRAIMEAFCLERPVIATRIRGVTELVDESRGMLTEVGDVQAMAAALRKLVDEPRLAAEFGRAGREAMKVFDIRNLLRMHDDLYAGLLGRNDDSLVLARSSSAPQSADPTANA